MAKKKKEEEFSEGNIKVVKWMLKEGKTKKECCAYLKIAYNTKRLDSIIREFEEKEKRVKELKEKNKRKTLTEQDKKAIVEYYNEGMSMAKVAETMYISAPRVKKVLLEKNVPIRGRGKKNIKIDHITQDKSVKIRLGDEVFFAPKPIYDKKETKVFPCEPGKAKVIKVYDETFCDVWDEGIISEKVVWEPHINIESENFKRAWPNGPVENQHYRVYYQNVEGTWMDRHTLTLRYKEERNYSIKYGEDTYLVEFLDSDHGFRRYFATREELIPLSVIGK